MNTKIKLVMFIGAVVTAGTVYAMLDNPRASDIVGFYTGHTHNDGGVQGAPGHSGGTDSYGCHNASVPYHCH